MQPIVISGSSSGLVNNVKPFLITDQAFQTLYNAYVWRERLKKRLGLRAVGRLRRILTAQSLGVTDGAGNFSGNIKTILSLETNAEIEAQGTPALTVHIGAQNFTETSPGILSNGASGTGTINYVTGALTISTNPALLATPITIDFAYFPGLPVVGIFVREQSNVINEQTIFFDTKYAYIYSSGFQELVAGTTWDGQDFQLFYCTNYQGSDASKRLFFATNNNNSATVPMRYYDTTWHTFTPQVDATNFLLQALILIPYYGRLLALNTTEGTVIGDPSSKNYFARCRFSQIGDPTAATAWRSDQFGKGGFLDAPVNESITSAAFIKNTLVVTFERTTWQLRYVGEYGLPFIWERISSDFGAESVDAPVLFNDGVLNIGDKAITMTNAVGVDRIDLQIPDFIFGINTQNNGSSRVVGVRDYEKELVYWCYPTAGTSGSPQTYPNQVIVYNYRNNTWAQFRDNVTFFGNLEDPNGIIWGSQAVFWNNYNVKWADPEQQIDNPSIVCGNQQGFISFYMVNTFDDPSLAIKAINIGVTPVQLTIPNHNFQNGEDAWVYVTGVTYTTSTDLNNQIYKVKWIDANTIALLLWNSTTLQYANVTSTSVGTYIGLGKVTMIPQMDVITKDFNPYSQRGLQMKLSQIDFLTDSTQSAAFSIKLYMNSTFSIQGNLLTGNQESETYLTPPYYPGATAGEPSLYAWHRFYATSYGQFITLEFTYDDTLMNLLTTHQQNFELNAFTLWTRPGGRITF